MTTPTTDTSTRIITAAESAWTSIRRRHPDVPDVVTTLGAGTSGRASRTRYGHFATARWDRDGDSVPEVFLGGEGLSRGALAVLGTLLHEAAHGVAHTRGISDTSRQGRWHNKRFKLLAEELGIVVTLDPGIGWSPTTVPDATAEVYAAELAALGAALTVWRHVERGRSGSGNGVAAVCGCGRRIRASVAAFGAGPIVCGVCGQPFAAA